MDGRRARWSAWPDDRCGGRWQSWNVWPCYGSPTNSTGNDRRLWHELEREAHAADLQLEREWAATGRMAVLDRHAVVGDRLGRVELVGCIPNPSLRGWSVRYVWYSCAVLFEYLAIVTLEARVSLSHVPAANDLYFYTLGAAQVKSVS